MTCTHMQPATVRRRAPPPPCTYALPACSASEERRPGCAHSARCAWARPAGSCTTVPWLRECMQAVTAGAPQPADAWHQGSCAVRRGRRRTVFRTGAQVNSSVAHVRQRAHSLRRPPRTAPHARAGGWPSAPRCPRPPSARMASWRRPPRTCSACARAGRPRWPARATVTWRASRARCGVRAAAPPLALAQGRNLHGTGNQTTRTLQALSAL